MQKKIILKPEREKSLKRFHPWVFSGAIDKVIGNPNMGETVTICSTKNEPLAQAAFSPQSQIRARVWTWNPDEKIDDEFFYQRIKTALTLRSQLAIKSNAQRLIYSEADGLPGIIADQYNDVIVLQCLSAGAEFWKTTLVDQIKKILPCQKIYERSDAEVRKLEGLEPASGWISPPNEQETALITENEIHYSVDFIHGHKTGFYLDQRENRAKLTTLAQNKKVLNCFCYTGGFTLAALKGSAREVISVDSSNEVLCSAEKNLALNQLSEKNVSWMEGDVFSFLRACRDRGQKFDIIILDPPKFAPTSQHIEKAQRAYKDINLLAFKLLAPGGYLMTFSCSNAIHPELFQKIIAGAAADAKVNARIIERLGAAQDHPIMLHIPETDYLKGLLLQKSE